MTTTNQEFVDEFIKKNKNLIKNLSRRYIIPNRYSFDDVLHYIATTILTILTNRQNSDKPIENPAKYFSGCIVYYMIEYQRMNGFIFCLPKRPRKDYIHIEKEMKSKKFQYLNESHYNDKAFMHDGYMTSDVERDTRLWDSLTGLLQPCDAAVVECIYGRNMPLSDTSKHLGVAQSTCLNRRNRALRTLYDYFDNMSGEMKINVKEYTKFFQTREED